MSTATTKADRGDTARLRRARRRRLMDRFVIGGLILGAAIFALYPVVATYNNNFKSWEAAQTAVTRTNMAAPAVNQDRLAAAHEYNNNLEPTLLMDPISQDAPDDPAYQDYLSRLAGPAMATLRLPTIDAMLPIMHGTSDEVLSRGAGHVYGTSLPVGDAGFEQGNVAGTHAGISAHRGLPQLTGFDNLPDMKLGDEFFVDVAGQTLAYKVTEIHTVLPGEMKRLQMRPGEDLVTLVTCTPYGVNSHRLLVTGERIDIELADPVLVAATGFDWTPQDWMMSRLYLAGAALSLLIVAMFAWSVSDIRRWRSSVRTSRTLSATPTSQPTDPLTA